jgi:hypothetical protein
VRLAWNQQISFLADVHKVDKNLLVQPQFVPASGRVPGFKRFLVIARATSVPKHMFYAFPWATDLGAEVRHLPCHWFGILAPALTSLGPAGSIHRAGRDPP